MIDNARRMAEMGANVARINIAWGGYVHGKRPLQDPALGSSAPWVNDQLDLANEVCEAARDIRDDFRLLVMFDAIPSWVDGVSRNAHFVKTNAGCEQYAIAVLHVLNELGENCAYIELGNEVNQVMWVPRPGDVGTIDPSQPISGENPPPRNPDNPHAGDIPYEPYSRMVAYVVERIDRCAITREYSSGLATQQVLVGGLAIRGGSDSWVDGLEPINNTNQNYTVILQNYININLYLLCQTDAVKRERMQNGWALSVHLYPGIGHGADPIGNGTGHLNATDAMNYIKTKYDQFAYYTGNRDIWNDEFGISSAKVGEPQQSEFHRQMWLWANSKKSKLKGSVWFGFTDLDPMMQDSTSPYYKMGVIKNDGQTLKPAGNQVISSWSSLWT